MKRKNTGLILTLGILLMLTKISVAKPTEINITAPKDQKYSLNFNVKESICIKNVEELAKTIGKKGNQLTGPHTISVIREIHDEDEACPERPAVLYFTIKSNHKAYSCLLSYEYGGSKLSGFVCHETKSKEKVDKCIATQLAGEAVQVNIKSC